MGLEDRLLCAGMLRPDTLGGGGGAGSHILCSPGPLCAEIPGAPATRMAPSGDPRG